MATKPVKAKLVGKNGTEILEIDVDVGVIIHQDTRTDPAVRTFVFRKLERDREYGYVAIFEEVTHVYKQVTMA